MSVIEGVAAAIKDASDVSSRRFGLHDYSMNGRSVHVVRDYVAERTEGKYLFRSSNADEARAFYEKTRNEFVAKAALEAMRDPTPEMVQRGFKHPGVMAYKKMITAALEE